MTDPEAATEHDRALGAFIGLAVGDAIGTTVEFKPRGSFTPLTDMIGGGPFNLQPGQWTDDTSMALCLADSLLAHPDFDARDLMSRFANWMNFGSNSATGTCFDIGSATSQAIHRFLDSGDPIAGSIDARLAGNGSIMRLAPVALRWWRNPAVAETIARQQSQTTHGATEAVDGCALLIRILCRAITGDGIASLHNDDPTWAPAIRAIGQGTYRDKSEPDIRSSGYVVHTLQAACWAVHHGQDFQTAVLAAANLGDDADTVAAVTGQIAGALWGFTAIPHHWRNRLHDRSHLIALGKSLVDAGMTGL
jgi:ADP-ribosyl-[dinitrogen reductase] hydrolase